MIYMHCNIRVTDYEKWKAVMLADDQAQHEAGMNLIHLWRGIDDPNRAFFILEVHDREKTRNFLNAADFKRPPESAGDLELEWHFVEEEIRHLSKCQ